MKYYQRSDTDITVIELTNSERIKLEGDILSRVAYRLAELIIEGSGKEIVKKIH
jgi:hypothetical protein